VTFTNTTVKGNTPDDCFGVRCPSSASTPVPEPVVPQPAIPQPVGAEPAAPQPAVEQTVPVLSHLSIAPRNFRAATRGETIIHTGNAGARVSYVDSQSAQTTIRAFRHQPIRGCSARTRERCTARVFVGKFTHMDRVGVNAFRFSGRLDGRSLPAGDYELALTAKRSGRSSRTVTVRFRILPSTTHGV
jgi:hypothetical protein